MKTSSNEVQNQVKIKLKSSSISRWKQVKNQDKNKFKIKMKTSSNEV